MWRLVPRGTAFFCSAINVLARNATRLLPSDTLYLVPAASPMQDVLLAELAVV